MTRNASAASAPSPPWPAPSYAWYVTALLTLGYTISFVDRQVLNLLVEPIRIDLGVNDTQVSLLQGLGFVIPYVLMSLPLGRLVDVVKRVYVLLGGVVVWSVMTAVCGLTRTYPQLLLARAGVGGGEAALTPAAWSLLADYFPPEKLARPISVFLMGPYLGGGLALILGGQIIDWVASGGGIDWPVLRDLAPWQLVFVLVGLPGLALAALLLTVREPVRRSADAAGPSTPVTVRETIAYLRSRWRLYLAIYLGVSLLVVVLYALQSWVPTLLIRNYGWTLGDAGRTYGLIALVFGSLGVLSGPWLARRLARRYGDAMLRVAVVASVLVVPFGAAAPLMPSAALALTGIAIASYIVSSPLALVATVLQTVTPNRMRGSVAGLYVLAVNILGLGLGPTIVAALTDFVFRDPAALRYSLALTVAVVGPLAALTVASGLAEVKKNRPA